MMKNFLKWCETNQISIIRNDELFFIDTTMVIKPDFMLPNGIFIDLIKPEDITDVYLKGCDIFKLSFGTLIVIPIDIIKDIDTITKEDIIKRFNINL